MYNLILNILFIIFYNKNTFLDYMIVLFYGHKHTFVIVYVYEQWFRNL
jgi:hypothetical protein